MRTLHNVHERVVDAPAEAVGALIDRISAPDDPLSPSPVWPPILFDRPLAVGADGGHGFVRYTVGAYEPGRSIRFDFPPEEGGHHRLEVEPLEPGRCRIRHVIEQHQGLKDSLVWNLLIGPLHDLFVEEFFDNVTRAATPAAPLSPVRWTGRARALHRLVFDRARAVEAPAGAALAHQAVPRPDFTDAWQLDLRPGMPRDPLAWREVLPFAVRGSSQDELLLGEDAAHLDFRASVLIQGDTVTLTTLVQTHNRLGRLYFAVVRRVHPFMARRMLRRTYRRLAFAAPPAARLERRSDGVVSGPP
ncbi:DUF2867 domain-containing protein [Streptomyces purpureus]|uniref:DUF2867 domain-containing protein n=1 Tax=Streptomyces purpureus TaxID=1951 RepID=A0A918GX15_9ACTN|nr:DUF2867 domain-containing protein [Streptomyces purpureus]GGT12793.1 hypothetical protein GCM10014713_01540 [Streptomyces purpureus]